MKVFVGLDAIPAYNLIPTESEQGDDLPGDLAERYIAAVERLRELNVEMFKYYTLRRREYDLIP